MIKIIGCGNILRQDDGIGIYVIEELKKIPLSKDIELIDAGTRGFDMFSFLEGAQKIIIVDAVKNQDTTSPFPLPFGEKSKVRGRPGDIYHVDIDKEDIDTDQLDLVSTHDFSWQDGLAMSKKILGNRFPEKITFLGIEIENSEPGLGLSPTLKESLYKVVNLIQKELTEEE